MGSRLPNFPTENPYMRYLTSKPQFPCLECVRSKCLPKNLVWRMWDPMQQYWEGGCGKDWAMKALASWVGDLFVHLQTVEGMGLLSQEWVYYKRYLSYLPWCPFPCDASGFCRKSFSAGCPLKGQPYALFFTNYPVCGVQLWLQY